MRSAGLIVAMTVWVSLAPPDAAGQAGRIKVSYDVEFSTTGPLLDNNCTATGDDVLTGTLVGFEPAPRGAPQEYFGYMRRSTRITVCGSRTSTAGHDVVCSINIAGGGSPAVVLSIQPDGRDAYLKYLTIPSPSASPQARLLASQYAQLLVPAPAGRTFSTVTGTCDPVELAELQADYDSGETAGSPNGQPIEVTELPGFGRASTSGLQFPVSFPANPPESIWTLKVLARRP